MAGICEQLWNKHSSSDNVSEPSRSRRCSTETIYSIQDRETDLLRDTSDTEWCGSDGDGPVEFEPVTEPEEDGPVLGDSSGNSENEIISTKVIEVVVGDDGDLEFADSEQTASGGSDSEMDYYDYWYCAQCREQNNNPLYRYCEKCFKVRKNFFPPRPKRKHKLDPTLDSAAIPRTLSQDSGVETAANSQELAQEPDVLISRNRKRRADSADRNNKRIKIDYSGSETDSESESCVTKPLVKMVSDPALTVESDSVKLTKRAITDSLKEQSDNANVCIICYSEPKSSVFVHGRSAHICCCYTCARRVWARAKRCPVCNCKVSNVLKTVVV